MSTTDFAHTIGARYAETADLDIADIAKLIRKDIKAAVRVGVLPADAKYGVRIERYSLGQSINVRVVLADRPSRVVTSRMFEGQYGYTPEAERISLVIHTITASYNYDDSDILTDYSHVRYFDTVTIDGTREA